MKYFKTNNVIVRRFENEDAEQAYYNFSICENENKNDIYDCIIDAKNITETRAIIRSAINEFYTDEPIWAVEDKTTKNLIGFIKVSNYSIKNKMCNITWSMSYKYWNVSFMKDAIIEILNYLFTKKNIELVECSYYEQNELSGIILEQIGMTKEAILRDRRINENSKQKENFVIFSITKEEFFENNRVYCKS